MQSWLEGIHLGRKMKSSKADSNTWESFTRSELKLESVHQESPRSEIFRKRATKPLLKQKHHQKHLTWAKEKKNWNVVQWYKVLFSDESTFCISFGNQGPSVWWKSGETQNPCCLKSSVKFPQSVMIWAAMSSAGVGPLCFLKSTVNAAIYQEILEHFLLLTSFMEILISFSSRTWHLTTLPKVPKAGLMAMVLLIGQQTHQTWTPERIYGVLSRGRWETPDPTMQMTWRPLSKQPGLHYTWSVPRADGLHATPHWCSNSCKRRPSQVLSA